MELRRRDMARSVSARILYHPASHAVRPSCFANNVTAATQLPQERDARMPGVQLPQHVPLAISVSRRPEHAEAHA